MIYKLLLLCVPILYISICNVIISIAQPAVDFIAHIPQSGSQRYNDIYALRGRGYIMCGSSREGGEYGFGDILVSQITLNGELTWARAYPNQTLDDANSIIETDDGDFLIGGRHADQFYAMKINEDGDVIWRQDYSPGVCQAVIELKNGDYLLAGWITNPSRSGYVVRINTQGQVIWRHSYNAGTNGKFYSMRETEDGVVLTGWDRDRNHGGNRVWVIKIETGNGNQIWSQFYNEFDAYASFSLVSDGSGSFLLAGWAPSGGEHFFLMKVDNEGRRLWTREYPQERDTHEEAYCLARVGNYGYALVGRYTPSNVLPMRPVMLMTSRSGDQYWKSIYQVDDNRRFTTGLNYFTSIVQAMDGSLIAAGAVLNVIDTLYYDGFVMKLVPEILEPRFIYHSPEDTILNVLLNDTLRFMVSVNDAQDDEVNLLWMKNGLDTLGRDTTILVEFDSLGLTEISCLASDGEFTSGITWHITVSDLFIARHTPDTLDLTLRRGASQTFTLDSVATVQGDDPIQYLWTLADLTNQQSNEIGEDSSVTVDFVRSGNYAVTGEAYRNDASDAVTWRVAVRGAVLDFVPPALELTVRTDTTLHFEVFAFNPGSDSLSYAWYYGEDLIGLDSAAEVIFGHEEGEYQIRAVVMDGMEGDTVRWQVRTVTPDGIEDCRLKIADWGIEEVWPNPFNSQLTISIKLPSTSASASLTIHDITGREVARLTGDPPFYSPPASKGGKESGIKQGGNSVTQSLSHSVTSTWDASSIPAGVYLIRLQSRGNVTVKKVVLMR